MATHSIVLAWRIPGTGEPSGLPSLGSHRVGHNWSDLAAAASQGYGFSCGHAWMWELDCEEGWVPKNWCFWTVVLEKTLESPLDCKEIEPVHSEGDQPWDFFGRNDAKAETPVLWLPHTKSWLFGKDSDAGRDWGQEEKGTTENEIAGWHHRLDGRESGWSPGVGVGQGGLACWDSWGRKESDTTEWLIWSDLIFYRRDLNRILVDKLFFLESLCSSYFFCKFFNGPFVWVLLILSVLQG